MDRYADLPGAAAAADSVAAKMEPDDISDEDDPEGPAC
jgi:hypothetical protein